MIPKEFQTRMSQMLGTEYEEFEKTFGEKKYQALRINQRKYDKSVSELPFDLESVPWTQNGYYYTEKDQPGKHPYHEAGLYYIQEPSAMTPVSLMDIREGEFILDLCAAPGGKSTQLADRLCGTGLLISNEINHKRAEILSENVERLGMRNVIVTNETPQNLATHFENYFDQILVDAPCSGEGMFRKNEEASEEWSEDNVKMCARRQLEILEEADKMLKQGGRIMYSTCTFAPDENEGTITNFLKAHPEYVILEVDKSNLKGADGRVDFYAGAPKEIEKTVRLWPHKINGEGHFAAYLVKGLGPKDDNRNEALGGYEKGTTDVGELKSFLDETFNENSDLLKTINQAIKNKSDETKEKCGRFGDNLYLFPAYMPSLKGLKVMRPGLQLGTLKKNRFEPSHALALTLTKEDVQRSVSYSCDSKEIHDYLNGLTLSVNDGKGWCLVLVDGFSLGFGKITGNVLKNHYPKGLRK